MDPGVEQQLALEGREHLLELVHTIYDVFHKVYLVSSHKTHAEENPQHSYNASVDKLQECKRRYTQHLDQLNCIYQRLDTATTSTSLSSLNIHDNSKDDKQLSKKTPLSVEEKAAQIKALEAERERCRQLILKKNDILGQLITHLHALHQDLLAHSDVPNGVSPQSDASSTVVSTYK